jgi:hypothetical protein
MPSITCLNAGIIGMCHQDWLSQVIFIFKKRHMLLEVLFSDKALAYHVQGPV